MPVTDSTSLITNLLRSAAQFPDRCLIQDGDSQVTYSELLAHTRTVSGELLRRGLQGGDRVAIILPNSGEFVAALYGTLMAGGIAVLLNPEAKSRDFEAWLRDSEPTFLFAQQPNRQISAALLSSQLQVLYSAGNSSTRPFGLPANPVAPPRIDLADYAPACILYTSGTTGHPKGVVLSHRNLAENTASICSYLALTDQDSIVCVLPFFYSYGGSVLHTHLKVGGRIILEKNFVYPHAVVETLARERTTGFAGVPSTYALLLSRVNLARYDLSALRYLTQAGGAMPPALTLRLRDALPHAALFVMYGQTEATARLTYLPPERLPEKLGSVGIPVPNVTIMIRSEDGAPLPHGTVGEIWAQGPNVMIGYWRNQAATSDALREGWLKTGDMGYVDDEGYVFIVGRRSDIIKVGAHRVHPKDIEDAVSELAGVQDVAVAGVDDETFGQVICVFVVPQHGATLTPMQVKAHCRARLAIHKLPKRVEIVATLPRTASGKVLRADLSRRGH